MEIIDAKLNWAGALAKRSTIDMIVLHHADAKHCSIYNIHNWHLSNGWSGCGYHFFINKQGKIFTGRPENVIGSHTKGFNATSIGICFEGRYNTEIMPEVQIKAGRELVQYLKNKYKITKVKKHKDLMSTDCPGGLFPFEEIVGQGKENLVLSFQRAAIADNFKFPEYGADGKFGGETQLIMEQCIIKRRLFYKYKNCTALAQRLLGIKADGLCGPETQKAIKKFQEQNNLFVDGCIGVETWRKLLKIR